MQGLFSLNIKFQDLEAGDHHIVVIKQLYQLGRRWLPMTGCNGAIIV